MKFRYDINTLRAFSILSVLGFHFYPDIVPGGFIGVDVFFVLSGFLMTKIIATKLENNSFSLIDFYCARINRIIPVYSIFLLTIGVTGFLYVSPWDFKTIGRDLATSSLFLSNIMFSMRSGYFEVTDNFLLHTWSLSVEWQFYLLFPLILLCIERQNMFNRLHVLLTLFCLSFISNVYYQFFELNEAYFLLWTRAWELICGAIVFEIGLRELPRIKYITTKLQLVSWLTLIILVFFVNKSYFWPGLFTLIPVTATLIVLLGGSCYTLYRNNLVKLFGLSSYSIYLWHWPFVVMVSYYGLENEYKYIFLSFSIIIGIASYYVFEQQLAKFKTRRSALFWVTISIVTATGGSLAFYTGGFAARVGLNNNPLVQGGMDDTYKLREGIHYYNSNEKDYSYLVIGDSNSNHLLRGILSTNTPVKTAWYGGCLSLPKMINKIEGYYPNWKHNCEKLYDILSDETTDVVWAQSWIRDELECKTEYKNCLISGNYLTDLKSQLQIAFHENEGKQRKIFLIGELPKPIDDKIMRCLRKNTLLGANSPCPFEGRAKDYVFEVNKLLESIAFDFESVVYIDPTKYICKNKVCQYSIENKSLFMSGGGHLSSFGASFFWTHILMEVERSRVR